LCRLIREYSSYTYIYIYIINTTREFIVKYHSVYKYISSNINEKLRHNHVHYCHPLFAVFDRPCTRNRTLVDIPFRLVYHRRSPPTYFPSTMYARACMFMYTRTITAREARYQRDKNRGGRDPFSYGENEFATLTVIVFGRPDRTFREELPRSRDISSEPPPPARPPNPALMRLDVMSDCISRSLMLYK